tara:strand:- start:578 stop:898 length:321 start_codon:yes stop_codon:yes gene_type:complete
MLRKFIFGTSAGLAGIIYLVIQLGGLAIHLYTTYLAFQVSGIISAIITFVFPPISELFWIWRFWSLTGEFFNFYTQWICFYLLVLVVGYILIAIFGSAAAATADDD